MLIDTLWTNIIWTFCFISRASHQKYWFHVYGILRYFFVFSPLCSGRLARIANGMAVAEHYAPFVRRFLPVLNDLSLTVKLEQQDRHENNCALRKSSNCCSNNNHYSRNLEKSYPQFRGQFRCR